MSRSDESSECPSAVHRPAYQRRKEQRPDEILAASLEEFFEHGFKDARLDRIADRAGVSRSTLYLYFENKEALFDAVTAKVVGSFHDEASATAMSFEGTTEELLRSVITLFYTTVLTTNSSAIMRILISEGHRLPELVDRYHAAVVGRGREIIKRIVERGIERGEIEPGPIARYPQIIVSPAMFYLINQMVFSRQEDFETDAFREAHLDLVLNGIGLWRASGQDKVGSGSAGKD